MPETYRHGVYLEETATLLTPMTQISAPPVAIGTAPLHLATDPAPVNVPIMCSTYADFVKRFGFSEDFDTYTLCEVARAAFQLYAVAPVVFINVAGTLDGTKELAVNNLTLSEPVMLSTLVVKSGDATLTENVDYTAAYNSAGAVTIELTDSADITDGKIQLTYKKLNPTVTATDIIGGVDAQGQSTGLEAVEQVYPKWSVVPGTLIAPKFSTDPLVAAVLHAKAARVNGIFQSVAAADISTTTARSFEDVNAVKSSLNYSDAHMIACWPMISLGGQKYHLSTHVAMLMGWVDAAHNDMPYKSPSNALLQMSAAVLADGTEINLSRADANFLNGQGVVTALNFSGWRCWGNNLGAYPTSTDPRERFIPIRRMMNWVGNTFATSYFPQIDEPLSKRLVEDIASRANLWLNGLAAQGAILGGRVEFSEDDNPTTSLLDGAVKFRVYIAPPPPAEEIVFTLTYDSTYLSTLFEG